MGGIHRAINNRLSEAQLYLLRPASISDVYYSSSVKALFVRCGQCAVIPQSASLITHLKYDCSVQMIKIYCGCSIIFSDNTSHIIVIVGYLKHNLSAKVVNFRYLYYDHNARLGGIRLQCTPSAQIVHTESDSQQTAECVQCTLGARTVRIVCHCRVLCWMRLKNLIFQINVLAHHWTEPDLIGIKEWTVS